jgi:superkiller protein 3
VFRFLLLLVSLPLLSAGQGLPEAANLFRAGKIKEAQILLDRITKEQPGNPAAWNLLGAVLDEQKDYPRAEASFARALSLAPDSVQVLNNFGNHQLAAGKPDQALATFRKVLKLDPAHSNANLQVARLLVDRKDGKTALLHLARLQPPYGDAPGVLLLRVRALFLSGQRDEAFVLLDRIESAANSAAAWYSIGLALGQAGEYSRAETAFSKALQADPANPDIQHDLGLAAMRAGNPARAQTVFEGMLRVNPQDPEALFQLGRAAAEQAHYFDALILLAKARVLAPQREDIIHTIATTAAKGGYFGDAAVAFGDYLKLRPDDEVARRDRGFAYACAGVPRLALPDLEWYAKRHPSDAQGQFELGFGLTSSNPAKAFEHLDQAIRLKPDLGEAVLSRGALYQNEGDTAKALPDLERAAKLMPNQARALVLLGRAYIQLDRPQDAVPLLRRAYQLAPNDTLALMYFGRALNQTGQEQEGSKILEQLARIGGDKLGKLVRPGTLNFLNLPPEEFNKEYEKSLKIAVQARSGAPEVRRTLARFFLETGRRDESLAEYRGILSAQPGPDVLAVVGRDLLEAGEYEMAWTSLEGAIAAGTQPDARLDLVLVHQARHDPNSALRELDQIPEKDRSGDYYLLRAHVLDSLGKVPEAIESLNLGMQKAPTRADLYENAAALLLKHGMDADAQKLLDKAAAVLPNEPNLLLFRATVLAINGRGGDAIAATIRISNRWPEWARPYLVRSIIEKQRANISEELKNIRTAIDMGERTPEAYFQLAQALHENDPDNPKPAYDAALKAAQLDPSDPWSQALAGRLAWQLGDYDTSLKYLREGIRLRADFLQAHFWLAATLRSLGKGEEAQKELEEVRRIHDQNPHAEEKEAPNTRDRLFPAGR